VHEHLDEIVQARVQRWAEPTQQRDLALEELRPRRGERLLQEAMAAVLGDPVKHRFSKLAQFDRDEMVRAYDAWCKQGPLDEAVHYFAAAVTELCVKAMR